MNARTQTSPGHAPRVGRLVRWLGPLGITGVFWYRLHLFGVRNVPDWLKAPALALFTTFFFIVLVRIRRAIAANLEPVLGPAGFLERQRRSFRTMHTFAWCLTERYERLAGDERFEFEARNVEAWREAWRAGHGVLFVTGHIGNWEVGSTLPASYEGAQIHVVREEESDPRAQRFIKELLRNALGERYTTHFAAGDPGLALRLREALGRGEVVALQIDRPRRKGRTVATRLFGREFLLPIGPLVLARSAAAPLLPAFVLRTGRRRYRLVLHEPLQVANRGERAADLRGAADDLAAALERTIAEHPHQWFCFGPAWIEGDVQRVMTARKR